MSKLVKFNSNKNLVPENIWSIYITLEVSKFDKSKESKEVQSEKVFDKLIIFEFEIFGNLIDFNDLQELNI